MIFDEEETHLFPTRKVTRSTGADNSLEQLSKFSSLKKV